MCSYVKLRSLNRSTPDRPLAHISILCQMPTKRAIDGSLTALQPISVRTLPVKVKASASSWSSSFLWAQVCGDPTAYWCRKLGEWTWYLHPSPTPPKKTTKNKNNDSTSPNFQRGILWTCAWGSMGCWVFGLLLHLQLEQHERSLSLAFSQSQRTWTFSTLLQGKRVEPLPIAEGEWSLEWTLLLRRWRERVDKSFNFCKWIPSSPSCGLNFQGLLWVAVKRLSSFCSPVLYWSNNNQELLHGNTVRINGKDRKELTFIELLTQG